MTHEVKEEEPNNTGEEETGSNWDDDSESHKTNHEETESNLDREKEFNLDEALVILESLSLASIMRRDYVHHCHKFRL